MGEKHTLTVVWDKPRHHSIKLKTGLFLFQLHVELLLSGPRIDRNATLVPQGLVSIRGRQAECTERSLDGGIFGEIGQDPLKGGIFSDDASGGKDR